jgi:hypothetical protein
MSKAPKNANTTPTSSIVSVMFNKFLEYSNKWQLSERAIPMVQFSYEYFFHKSKTLMEKWARD